MEAAEKMLLEQILDQQKEMRETLSEIKSQVGALEGGIMVQVGREFVRKADFCSLWKQAHKDHEKENYESFSRTTSLVEKLIKWGGWIVSVGVAIAYVARALPM